MSAQDKYFENSMEIKELISKLQTALESHQAAFTADNGNWGMVGDLGMVKSELKTLEVFIQQAGK